MKWRIGITLALLSTAACDTKTVISEGDRVGVITKFSHKRMSCFGPEAWNWEGELTMQGGTNAGGQGQTDENGTRSSVGVWQFSLDPTDDKAHTEEMVSEVREALNSQRVVRASYKQTAYTDCHRESEYMITTIVGVKQ